VGLQHSLSNMERLENGQARAEGSPSLQKAGLATCMPAQALIRELCICMYVLRLRCGAPKLLIVAHVASRNWQSITKGTQLLLQDSLQSAGKLIGESR
jgi:hypothetical protein